MTLLGEPEALEAGAEVMLSEEVRVTWKEHKHVQGQGRAAVHAHACGTFSVSHLFRVSGEQTPVHWSRWSQRSQDMSSETEPLDLLLQWLEPYVWSRSWTQTRTRNRTITQLTVIL